jgi:hypothetical protein
LGFCRLTSVIGAFHEDPLSVRVRDNRIRPHHLIALLEISGGRLASHAATRNPECAALGSSGGLEVALSIIVLIDDAGVIERIRNHLKVWHPRTENRLSAGPIRPCREAGPFPSTITRYQLTPERYFGETARPEVAQMRHPDPLPDRAETTPETWLNDSSGLESRMQRPVSVPRDSQTP